MGQSITCMWRYWEKSPKLLKTKISPFSQRCHRMNHSALKRNFFFSQCEEYFNNCKNNIKNVLCNGKVLHGTKVSNWKKSLYFRQNAGDIKYFFTLWISWVDWNNHNSHLSSWNFFLFRGIMWTNSPRWKHQSGGTPWPLWGLDPKWTQVDIFMCW